MSRGSGRPEKIVSYMRSEMRATAERNGRDPKIAEAMVDENVELADSTYKKHGQLLTLTTDEAVKLGYCDAVAPTLEAALDSMGYSGARIVMTDLTASESLVNFLTSPVLSSLLIMFGLGGLFFGMKTGHINTISILGIASIAIFFVSHYLVDLANAIEVMVFLVGLILIALEIFVIPGFGAAGVIGIVMVVASLFMALVGNFDLVTYDSVTVPLYTLAASLIGLGILVALMIKYLPQSSAFNKFVLQTTYTSELPPLANINYKALLGMEGEAMTTLRPAGTALLGNERVDVITEGEFIGAGEPVRVVRIDGRRIIVRRLQERSGALQELPST